MTGSTHESRFTNRAFHGRQLTLRDGRRLGYAEFGSPDGQPILLCHGFPASRLDGRLAHEAARRLGRRLIVPDRPGYGFSDFHAGRRISDWPRDVVELADALSLGRFAVLGISGGGPYAVACAGVIPDRLTSAGIVCGLGRADATEDTALMNPLARFSFALARSAPGLSQLLNRSLAPILRRSPHSILRLLASRLPPPDQEVLSDSRLFAMFAESYREAFRQGGRGAALDLSLYAKPWEISVASIRVSCHLWHGELDSTVPVTMANRLAAALPVCRARIYPEEGHFSLPVRRMEEVLAALIASD